jgi:hypothetical protein
MQIPSSPDPSAKWSALSKSWPEATPPASPSKGDIANYRVLIQRALPEDSVNSVALILGVTPLLRRLLADFNCSVTCIDANPDMIAAAQRVTYRREEFICRDWLGLEAGEFAATIVLGDKVFDNVAPSSWQRFKHTLLAIVPSGGYFITRLAAQDPAVMGVGLPVILREAADCVAAGMSEEEAVAFLWERALGASADSVPGEQSLRRFRADIEALRRPESCLTAVERSVLDGLVARFGGTLDATWSSYSLGSIIDLLMEELRPSAICWSDDYPAAQRQPIIAFEAGKSP